MAHTCTLGAPGRVRAALGARTGDCGSAADRRRGGFQLPLSTLLRRELSRAGWEPLGEVAGLFSIGKLAAASADYYLAAVAQGVEDYRLGVGEPPGLWLGRGSAELGLAWEVSADDLRRALAGLGPDGRELASAPAGRARVPGYDLTFSAAKSVSLLHALGDPSLADRVVARARGRGARGARLPGARGRRAPPGSLPGPGRDRLYLASDGAQETAAEDLRTHRWEPEPDPVRELARDLERSEGRRISMDLGL